MKTMRDRRKKQRKAKAVAEGKKETMDGKMRETVKLISIEGFEFVIDREAAMVSHTIRSMLTSPGGFSESKDGVVTFPDISTPILEKICQYFYWSLQYSRFHHLTRVEECTNRKIVSLQTLYPLHIDSFLRKVLIFTSLFVIVV